MVHSFQIADELEQVGYSSVYDPVSEIWGIKVFIRDDRVVCCQDELFRSEDNSEDVFRNYQDILARYVPRVTDMFFPGGGSVAIPEWFKQWCAEHGVAIHIVEKNDLVRETVDGRSQQDKTVLTESPNPRT